MGCLFKILKALLYCILAIIVIGILSVWVSDDKPKHESTLHAAVTQSEESTKSDEQPDPKEEIKYVDADAGAMLDELEKNAMKASKHYKGMNVHIMNAKVMNIESGGDFFTISSPSDEFGLTAITIHTRDDDQKPMLENLEKGQYVNVYCHIFDVGEILGFNAELDSIE